MSSLRLQGTLHRLGRMATSPAGDTHLVTVHVERVFVSLAEPLPQEGVIILGLPSSRKTALLRDVLRERFAGRLSGKDASKSDD